MTSAIPNNAQPTRKGLLLGYQANPDQLAALIGPRARRIHPRVWSYYPFGHRLLVVADHMPDELESGLALPETVRSREQYTMGAGVVIAVGPQVGEPPLPWPGGPVFDGPPGHLLYQHVFFQSHTGSDIRQSLAGLNNQYDQLVLMLSDRDLLLVDNSDPSSWDSIG